MSAFNGQWKDQDGATITVEGSNNFSTFKYSNGRGPFQGVEVDLGSPVASVYFNDGSQPAAGVQAGVLNFNGDQITWSNDTVWKKV